LIELGLRVFSQNDLVPFVSFEQSATDSAEGNPQELPAASTIVILLPTPSWFTLRGRHAAAWLAHPLMSEPKLSSAGADWTKLLMDQELIPHLGTLLQAYRDAPPEKREEILLETLRKIKSTAPNSTNAAPAVSATVPATGGPAGPAPMEAPATPPFEPEVFTSTRAEDRRRHARMKCFVAVELRVEGSQTPVWGNLSNSSMGGCFVETPATIASGTKLEIGLWVASGKIWIKGLVLNGIVTRSNPSVGARVKFEELGGSERETLRQFMKFVDTTTQSYQAEQGYLAQMKR
jgi:hypothetical protein